MSTEQRGTRAPSRRSILKGAAAAGAAAAFPTIVPSSVLGQQAGRTAPSDRLTMGFIGIGKQASGHLGYMAGRKDVQILAVCDVDKVRRENAKERVESKYKELQRTDYKGCDQYVDFRELLTRKDIDSVVIGTPDHWHTIPLIEAAKAKKHIYCEKPLTLTIHEAKVAVEAVRKHGVVFQTGSQQRSEGPFRDVVDLIRSGRIGKVKEVFVALGGTHSDPCDLPEEKPASEIDWERWLGPAPLRGYAKRLAHAGELPDKYPFNPGWREFREYSGGYVTDWGAHHIDITHWALSMDGSGPSEVLPPEKADAQYGVRLVYRGSPAGDEVVVHHVRETPAIPDHRNAGRELKQNNGILFVGDKGKIFVNRSMKVGDPAAMATEALGDGATKLPNTGQHRDNWLKCIRSTTGERPVCDVHVGAGSVTACHLVNLAYRHRQKMQWDPKAWRFKDEAQNQWLDYARRGPYQLPDIG